MAGSETSDSEPATRRDSLRTRTAGAYGFTRPEIIILAIVGIVVIALSIGQWMKRRAAAKIPAWTTEDVLIDSMRVAEYRDSTASGKVDEYDTPDYKTVDVNTASHAELMRLPGIGGVLANRIIAARNGGGPFETLIDFQRVQGIGPKKAAALAGWVRFSRLADSGKSAEVQ